MPGYSNWCFTLNNYSGVEYDEILSLCQTQARYFIIGKESGDSGTPHLQGFISFFRRHNFKHVSNLFGPRVHLEGARCTARQNRAYCSKGGDFTEGGDIPKEGNPNTSRDQVAISFRDAYTRGAGGLAEFSSSFPGAWYYSGFNLLRNTQFLIQPINRPDIKAEWVYGEPGVGKSKYAHEQLPEAYLKEPRTKWWNGYLHQATVIIDDFGPGGIDINHLLRWLDRYKCMVETKGGMVALHAQHFIITSNFHPEVLFTDSMTQQPHQQLPALMRRIVLKYM